jgi:ADP-heptose:LPS heptosyltransferase
LAIRRLAYGYGDRLIGKGYALRHAHDPDGERTIFDPRFKVKPGKLDISNELMRWATRAVSDDDVLVNPHVKKAAGRSKDWGWGCWEELASRSKHQLVQCAYGKPLLPGVEAIETPTFEHGAALIAVSRGIVTTEGGMHHAAGALRCPAVVIFGGTNPPSILGYDFHENLAVDAPDALGRRGEHPSCRAAMALITVDMVLEAMQRAFGAA